MGVKLAKKPTAGAAADYVPAAQFDELLLNTVHCIDCIHGLKLLPDHSVDVVIADPPYNASKGGNWQWDSSIRLPGFGGDWSKVMAAWDDMPLTEYFNFTLAWLTELKRILRPTGSMWIHGTYHNIGIINFSLQLLQIEIINEVVWYKRNSFPNLSGRRLTASHETILWAHTGGAKSRKYYFDYKTSKEMSCPEDNFKESGKQMRTVWDIPNNKGREEIKFGKHPTQKPVRLLKRMLHLSAKTGDLLLVPFAGSGSDCVAAKELGLHFLAFENDPHFVKICGRRLDFVDDQFRLNFVTGVKGKESGDNDATPVHDVRRVKTIPSLIKWTGSKRSQASAIALLMPRYNRYFEPFLGGGALLYLAATKGSVAGDVYEPLIKLWKLIQSDPERVIADYETKWLKLTRELDKMNIKKIHRGDGLPRFFYSVRKRFNERKDPLDLNFVMRTCVNGIARFNHNGEFNNSFHLSRRGMEPDRFRRTVKSWHAVIQGVKFYHQDFTKTVATAKKDDFVYLDPPYAGNRCRYVADLNLDKLFETLEMLNNRGTKWALSFDGRRGSKDFTFTIPDTLYKRQLYLTSGNSAVNKVLNGPLEKVEESLYLNY